MKIDKEFQSLIPPLLPEETQKLEESIKSEGIRDPLITWKGILIDGHNRYSIAKQLNVKYKVQEKKFKDRNEVILWMINTQLGRRNISSYNRIILALKYEDILKPIAKANQGMRTDLDQTSDRSSKRVLHKVGEIAKVSHDTVSKVKYIEENANKEQKERLSRQVDSINKVYHEVKKKIVEEKPMDKIELPKQKFSIIVADPPWKYNFSQTNERSIETHYDSMDLDKIKSMKVPTEEDSVLFLWATAPKLKEALEVMEAWGFEYKTCAVWDKEIIGMGYWFRGQHELLLVGTKGKVKPPKPKLRLSSMIKSKRGKHSKKPLETHEMIETMFPKQTYLELFARSKREGWTSWGNEVS